ncbi:MAG: integrase core domain-containing protein [Rhodobiaceae bacterium]|nr:integrase core domain-containing protein [Rhodobiaceae bacterium]
MTLDDARAKIEEWRVDYNHVRPHSAIGNKPPISVTNGSSAPSSPEPDTPDVPGRADPKTGGQCGSYYLKKEFMVLF